MKSINARIFDEVYRYCGRNDGVPKTLLLGESEMDALKSWANSTKTLVYTEHSGESKFAGMNIVVVKHKSFLKVTE